MQLLKRERLWKRAILNRKWKLDTALSAGSISPNNTTTTTTAIIRRQQKGCNVHAGARSNPAMQNALRLRQGICHERWHSKVTKPMRLPWKVWSLLFWFFSSFSSCCGGSKLRKSGVSQLNFLCQHGATTGCLEFDYAKSRHRPYRTTCESWAICLCPAVKVIEFIDRYFYLNP